MIRFFRHIRNSLITNNKLGRYLLYSIGEIILIVIGILIALSINNWNNNKIRTDKERSLLKDMLVDLNQNIQVSKNVLIIHNSTLTRNIALRQNLLEKTVKSDSLVMLIASLQSSATPTLSTSTYKTISQSGLNIITSDTLRKSILRYYEVILPYVDYKSNQDPKNQFQTLFLPYFNKYFKIELDSNNSIVRTVNDRDKLFDDNEFLNVLHTTIRKRKRLMDHLKMGIENSEFLIQEITFHLDQQL